MFLGEYQHTLDAKGRVSLPRKCRDAAGSRLVVFKGLDGCLYLYTEEGYAEFLAKLKSAGDFDRNSRAVRRHFTAGASEADIDSAGRIAIPLVLREHAHLNKDVVVNGIGDHMEIWDAAAWGAYKEQHAPGIEDAAEELARQGIL